MLTVRPAGSVLPFLVTMPELLAALAIFGLLFSPDVLEHSGVVEHNALISWAWTAVIVQC